MSSESRSGDPGAKARQHRVGNTFLLVLSGLIGTLAITVMLRWTTAFLVIAGTIMPVVLGVAVARVSRYRLRYPGLIGLVVTLAGILLLCWIAKYPDPAKAFAEGMRMPVPASVRNLSAERGWYDGQITVLRFTAEDGVIRGMVPAGAGVRRLGREVEGERVEDASWQGAIGIGMIIDPALRRFPGWKEPWYAAWNMESASLNPAKLGMAWDAVSGNAIVCVHQD